MAVKVSPKQYATSMAGGGKRINGLFFDRLRLFIT
jgi:hypothetical protein